MRRVILSAIGAALSAALTSGVACPARAEPTKAECIEANRQAQGQRRLGRLAEARTQLRLCLDPACPKLVSADCAQRLDDLERVQPTIVFDVKDADGHDLAAPELSIDGQILEGHADGTPIALDPGAHTFVFRAIGRPPATRVLVLKEGDRAREEHVQLEAPAAIVAAAYDSALSTKAVSAAPIDVPPAAGQKVDSHSRSAKRQQAVGGILAAVGAGALANGAAFAGLAAVAKGAYEQHCGTQIGAPPSRCNPEGLADHNDAVLKANVATGSLIAGAVALAAGFTIFISAGPTRQATAFTFSSRGAWLSGDF